MLFAEAGMVSRFLLESERISGLLTITFLPQAEVLVYNVSLQDMHCGQSPTTGESECIQPEALLQTMCRPKFAKQRIVSEALQAALWEGNNDPALIWAKGVLHSIPVGFKTTGSPARTGLPASAFKWRCKMDSSMEQETEVYLHEVYFPMLCIVLDRWQRGMANKQLEKVIYLVSGVGQKQEDNGDDPRGNSTGTTAKIMKAFIERNVPNAKVELVHSDEDDVFHYGPRFDPDPLLLLFVVDN